MKLKLKDLKSNSSNINLDEYIKFREYVKEHMEHPEWLGDFSKEAIINMLENNSKIWIYYLDNKPVCSMMFIPSTLEDINTFEMDLDYRKVADYGPMMVSPSYIGNNLQYQMLKEIDKYSIAQGYKYAVATAHPDNVYSIYNLLKDNFTFTKQKTFKRGIRNIYLKTLNDK